jgi:hypothetical protein
MRAPSRVPRNERVAFGWPVRVLSVLHAAKVMGLPRIVPAVSFAMLAWATGCAGNDGMEREIALAQHGVEVQNGMDDLDAGRSMLLSRLERLEELVRASPDRVDVRKLLTVAWAQYALLFVEDEIEEARERGDSPTAGYHAMRARNAYERAIHHAKVALGASSFESALSADTVAAYLAGRPNDDPELLLWMGAAWLGRVRIAPEDRKQLAGQAHVGEALLERSIALDPKGSGGWAQTVLGLWRGRSGGDIDRARSHFDRATEASQRKLLLVQVFLARTVVCQTHDKDRWDALFKEVLDARDPSPDLRLQNAVAKRKAARDIRGTRRAQCVP